MRRGSGRLTTRIGHSRSVWRRVMRPWWLVMLAACLLAAVPCVAQATSITGFTTFPNGGPSVPTMSWPFGLQVTYSDRLSPWDTGKLYEETGGGRVTLTSSCIYYGCAVNAPGDTSTDYAHPPTRTFEIVLYHTDTGAAYDQRTLVVHERRLHFDLDADFDWSPGLFHVTVPWHEGGTLLDTIIYRDGSEVKRCNVYWSHCETPVTAGAVYYAAVKDPDGNVYGITPSYLATSSTTGVKETADNVDLVRLGALFASTSDVCNTLLNYPYGTHVEGSPTDQWVACDTAVRNGSSMWDLLRSVAAAGGGTTAVLWWLEHQQTIQVLSPDWPTTTWPDAQVPAIPDLPQSWQGAILNVADAYMLQAGGTDLTQAAAEAIAAACLWNASRVTNARMDCVNLPVFVTGSDVAEATDHDIEAIVRYPQWVKLNYESSAGKAAEPYQDRYWFRSQDDCLVAHDEDESCDEYPFWASEQGGSLARPLPSLRYIDSLDNRNQGLRYGNFVTSCGLTTGTPQEGANSTGGTAFLVVPLASGLGIPSYTRLCNR
jgi:hypothetical protein